MGLAGLAIVARDRDARASLGITPASRILVIGSEGDTEPVLYRKIIAGETYTMR